MNCCIGSEIIKEGFGKVESNKFKMEYFYENKDKIWE